MIAPLSDRIRLDEAHHRAALSGSRATQLPFETSFRMEYAREWGPCVLGIDQSMRSPLSAFGPVVFCGCILPCVHETEIESQGNACCFAASLSGNDQMRMGQMIQADPYIAWLLRVIPSEAADGARCSMGVLEHTTAASIIKEAMAAGVDIRGIRVSASCDPMRFRQFLYEAFPMIDDISVYSRPAPAAPSTTTNPMVSSCVYSSPAGSQYMQPSSPQSLPSSPLSPVGTAAVVPPAICVAGVVSQTARDTLSRQMLYRQRQSPSPISRSPLSKPIMNASRRRDRLTSSVCGSFFSGPMTRYRSSSEENTHMNTVRCAAYAGSEFGEAHCGLVNELSLPSSSSCMSQSQTMPIEEEMYDFYDDDDEDDSGMGGLTSPKRIRVVPCSPPLITCEDTLPPCVSHSSTVANGVVVNPANHVSGVDSFDSSPFSSTSLFVSPPPFASSTASTSVPIYHPVYGLTSPF